MFRDDQERTLERRIGCELFGTGKEPGVDLRVNGAQFGLQARRVAFGIVHQKSWIDAEEPCEQLARGVRQMRPGAILNLREVRLTEAAANFAFHRTGQLLLRHRAAQSTKRAFYSAEGAEFVA